MNFVPIHKSNPSLLHFVQESVNCFSHNEAVVYQDRRVTYQQLWTMIGAVATYLKKQGVVKGSRVGILIENSPEYIATYYGVLAAECVAIGLNTATKSRDLVNWLRHSQASWLFAEAKHRELPNISESIGKALRIIAFGEMNQSIGHLYGTWLDVQEYAHSEIDISMSFDTQSLASIIYTSGTTGHPKGVMLSHANLAANTRSILQYLELENTDSIVNVLPFYYSYGNSVLHTHMSVGGRVVLENNLVYPHKVIERMVAERVTGFSGVPSTFALILGRVDLSEYDLSAVRYMTQAGGPMPPASIRRLTDKLPDVKFFVMYGQTEASARLTYLPPDMLNKKLGSVGRPIEGVDIEIRDEGGDSVGPGVTGEIWAKGDNIMVGYWRNPMMTQEVLQNGWLKTGDLAHFDHDRYIYIDGRNSDMIKVGAHRISPKEIEEVIAELEGIEEVAAVGIPHDLLGQAIKVFVVCKPSVVLDKKVIQKHCLQNLAQYKIPKQIEFIKKLPKTASGKVKRHLL